ncbi:hypothetical protein MRX96_010141 [Rhipicephalus microplus]
MSEGFGLMSIPTPSGSGDATTQVDILWFRNIVCRLVAVSMISNGTRPRFREPLSRVFVVRRQLPRGRHIGRVLAEMSSANGGPVSTDSVTCR